MITNRRKVGIRELRQDASGVLREVKEGATIEITEHGQPIAHLIPIQKSGWEGLISAGLVIPASIQPWTPARKRIRANANKTSTQMLMELRESEL